MKRFTHFITCALMLAGAASTRADVLIYDYRSSSKLVGEGLEFSASRRGHMIWNLEDNRMIRVTYSTRNGIKSYSVGGGVPLVASLAGSSGRQYTSYSGAGENNGLYFMEFTRGLNKLLKHRTDQYTQFPRSFKGTANALDTITGPRLSDQTHSAVYSQKRTIAANDAGQTQDEVVAALRAELEEKGYFDVSSTAAASTSINSVNHPPAPRDYVPGTRR